MNPCIAMGQPVCGCISRGHPSLINPPRGLTIAFYHNQSYLGKRERGKLYAFADYGRDQRWDDGLPRHNGVFLIIRD